MTDSESDTSNNVFNFQSNMTVSAKGPNTNITNLSFRNPITSTMCMPRNYEQRRYAESTYDQRSMYYRRETSPMSIHSACDIRPRNFQPYYSGMGSQQSVFNGRSGSPMSIRSIDSSASVSAADIAFAFKNVKFNKYDLKVIKEAYHKLMKQRVRKRIEKRRNMRLFLKGSRRRSGDDSGEQGSDSSVSSDDCRSIKTSYKENMSSSKSARIDLSEFRRTVRDSTMLKDCSDNFKQNTFKNKFTISNSSVNNSHNTNSTLMSKQINPMPTQKDRFRNGFLLPSQRFNKSVASSVIQEKPCKNIGNNIISNVKNYNDQNKQNNCVSGSEEEEIFSEITVREKSTFNIEPQRKRSLESEDESSLPDRKKSRISSPIKNLHKNNRAPPKSTITNLPKNNIEISNSFEFAKPTLPVRKSKPRVQEKLIAKSSQPLTDFLEPISNKIQEKVQVVQPPNIQEKSSENITELDQSETTQNSDVSTRPSFIKRKLFTQKLDVVEKANLSSDGINSPQNSVYSLQKEKNKARKLVTNQSCLNRDVQDDNNLLDLIHKIVPPDRINLTNQTSMNQTKNSVNNTNKKDTEDKWDVTTVLSMCNDDNVSDTYTDEEIFQADNTNKDTKLSKDKNLNGSTKKQDKVENNTLISRDCRIMVEKLQNNSTAVKLVANKHSNFTHNNDMKNNIKSSVKTFWDTDFESDAECLIVLPRSQAIDSIKKADTTLNTTNQVFRSGSEYIRKDFPIKSQQAPEAPKLLNNTYMNNTMDNTRKFNTSTLSVRSHRTSKKKKCFNETCCTIEANSKSNNQVKVTGNNKKENSRESNKKSENIKSKTNLKNKNNLNIENDKISYKSRSTSQSKKAPKEKKANKNKQDASPSNNDKKLDSKSNCANNNSKSPKTKPQKQQNNLAIKNKVEKKSESTKAKSKLKSDTEAYNDKIRKDTSKSPKNKSKPKTDAKNTSKRSKKNITVSQPSKSNLNTTIEPKQNNTIRSERPIRSCRTPSQNRSTELSRSSLLNNTSTDASKSLRSRVINLSSSIENITIKIKPRNKILNNKNISQINTRKSDVSFSLNKQTPTPNKKNARSKADFFKGKRKT